MVITLFFVIVFETIIKNGEGRGGQKISNQDSQLMKRETVADGLNLSNKYGIHRQLEYLGFRKRT
jgi:hypothetical protein